MTDRERWLAALDALADVLTAAHHRRRRHQMELLDEQREAMRDARAAYEDGAFAAREREQW